MPNLHDDDELISNLDQPIPVNLFETIETEIDEIYIHAFETKQVYLALNKARELIGGFRASGLGLAKLLYMLQRDWEHFNIQDTFKDVVFDYLGLSPVTITRYISVWEKYDRNLIPPDLQEEFKIKPMKEQIAIATTISQGYEIREEDWEKLANSPDMATTGAILREIKGKPMRKSGIMIVLKRSGDLIAWHDGAQYFLGWLDLKEAENDEVISKAIERIISNSNIRRE